MPARRHVQQRIDLPELPIALQLFANYPNPFNSGTQIAFDLPHESTVTVRIFDLQGRLLRTLLEQKLSPGFHRAVWNGMDEEGRALPSGIFCCYMRAGGQQLTQKMSLIR